MRVGWMLWLACVAFAYFGLAVSESSTLRYFGAVAVGYLSFVREVTDEGAQEIDANLAFGQDSEPILAFGHRLDDVLLTIRRYVLVLQQAKEPYKYKFRYELRLLEKDLLELRQQALVASSYSEKNLPELEERLELIQHNHDIHNIHELPGIEELMRALKHIEVRGLSELIRAVKQIEAGDEVDPGPVSATET